MESEVVAACADNGVVGKDLLKMSTWKQMQDILVWNAILLLALQTAVFYTNPLCAYRS